MCKLQHTTVRPHATHLELLLALQHLGEGAAGLDAERVAAEVHLLEVVDGVELLEVRRNVVARRELELRVAAQREGAGVRHGRSQAVKRAEMVEAEIAASVPLV